MQLVHVRAMQSNSGCTNAVLVEFPAILVLDGFDSLSLLLPQSARQLVRRQISVICAHTTNKAGIPGRRHGHRHRHPCEDRRENVGVSFSLP